LLTRRKHDPDTACALPSFTLSFLLSKNSMPRPRRVLLRTTCHQVGHPAHLCPDIGKNAFEAREDTGRFDTHSSLLHTLSCSLEMPRPLVCRNHMVVRSQHAIRPGIQRTSAQMKVRKTGIWGTEHNGRFEFASTHLTLAFLLLPYRMCKRR